MSDLALDPPGPVDRPRRRPRGGSGRDGVWLLPLIVIGLIGFIATDAKGGSCPLRHSPDYLAEHVLEDFRATQFG